MIFKICCFLILVLPFQGFSSECLTFSSEDTGVLEQFFRGWLEDTEGGYVLCGEKPICAHGFNIELFPVNAHWHRSSVAFQEGAHIWKKMVHQCKNSNFLMVFCEKEEERIPGWKHLFLINQSAFFEVFNTHRSLFQYVLGPQVTAKKLLENIKISFDAALKEDKVLTGIVLGYGAQNSLYVSRKEHISTYLSGVEDIPIEHAMFLPEEQTCGFFLPKPGTTHAYHDVSPSAGFRSLLEENMELDELIIASSEKLQNTSPEFIFGHINDREASLLIKRLEKQQKKISRVLKSENFLPIVLKKMLNQKVVLPPPKFHLTIDNEAIDQIVARGIWEEMLLECEKKQSACFIEKLTDVVSEKESTDFLFILPSVLQEMSKARQRLSEAASFFETLASSEGIQCVIPNNLYYRVLRPGEEGSECTSPQVRLKYTFFDHLGQVVRHYADRTMDVNETISGFAHGVKGMQKGETREIYIHPTLAYGVYTPYEKGTPWKSVVTLIEEVPSPEDFSEPTPVDLSFLQEKEKMELSCEETLTWLAHQIGTHLKKSQDIDLEKVKGYLQDFLEERGSFSPLSCEEKDLINKVHWNIYFGKNDS